MEIIYFNYSVLFCINFRDDRDGTVTHTYGNKEKTKMIHQL